MHFYYYNDYHRLWRFAQVAASELKIPSFMTLTSKFRRINPNFGLSNCGLYFGDIPLPGE